MSLHCTPASASALRMATAPISIPVVSPKRPNGWSPTPTMATSIYPLLVLRTGALGPRCVASRDTRLAATPLLLICSDLLDRSERERHDLVAVVVGAER